MDERVEEVAAEVAAEVVVAVVETVEVVRLDTHPRLASHTKH